MNCTIKSNEIGDWQPALSNLAAKLYTYESDLPKNVEVIDYPENLKAAKLLFKSEKSKNIADKQVDYAISPFNPKG